MSFLDELFYDLSAELVGIFKEEPLLFYITEKAERPFARPEDVTSYIVPREVFILCVPYKDKDVEDSGGFSRTDTTSTQKSSLKVFVPTKNVPEGLVLDPKQNARIEIEHEGQRLSLRNFEKIGVDQEVARILEFGSL